MTDVFSNEMIDIEPPFLGHSNCPTSALQMNIPRPCNQIKIRKGAMSKISLLGRTKEGLDDERFQKRSGAGTRVGKNSGHRKIFFKKRSRGSGASGNPRRSLRKKVYNVINRHELECATKNLPPAKVSSTFEKSLLTKVSFSSTYSSSSPPLSKLSSSLYLYFLNHPTMRNSRPSVEGTKGANIYNTKNSANIIVNSSAH